MSSLPQGQRLVSLAAGVVQEFPPEDVVYAAAEAGFNAVGLWCDLETWTDGRTEQVRKALDATGITALDIEVVWFKPGEALDAHDRFVDIAKTVGARNILCVSSATDINETKTRFKHMCQLAEGSDIRVVLEFLAITEIDCLAKALEVVHEVAHPAGGILIDTLHLQRTGSSAQDVAALAPALMPYIQLCDADKNLQDQSFDGILEDAISLRRLLGEGGLPLEELLRTIDANMPLSLEIRSRKLNEQFPNLQDRAHRVFQSTRKYFESHNHLFTGT